MRDSYLSELVQRWQLPSDYLENDSPWQLQWRDERLSLRYCAACQPAANGETSNPLPRRPAAAKQLVATVDWVSGTVGYRRRQPGIHHEAVARAVGIKGRYAPTVIDATAGWGRDAAILANLGCPITLVESHPVVAALLEDGLRRAAAHPETASMSQRMQLVHSDAATYLQNLPTEARPEVIYLDPMYPHPAGKARHAEVKQEMALLQLLVPAQQGEGLLSVALDTAQKRVVVKRPRGADALDNLPPAVAINSAKHRFDLYLYPKPLEMMEGGKVANPHEHR
ncbi:MAG: class I SAM-dependent methyltransferase [Gammaproteobacteria bacterium]|nr:class I SAM-dependent methyltransferase [Gammaproteobacteria bacterium]